MSEQPSGSYRWSRRRCQGGKRVEYHAREDKEAVVRIHVLVQIKNGPVLNEVSTAIPYTPAIEESMKPWVNRSLQCDDGTTFAEVKQGSKECGFESHRDL